MEIYRLADKENGPKAEKIKNDNIINFILENWNLTEVTFPGPQPVSLERKDLEQVKTKDYLVCVKSDGMRFIMIIYDGIAYMMDRSVKCFKINLNFKVIKFGIFDGELVYTKDLKWQYIIHDCINYDKVNVSENILTDRLKYVNLLLDDFIIDTSDFEITNKQFCGTKEIQTLLNSNINHAIDGLIFTPIYKRVGKFTQYDLLKWKERHTFDLKIHVNDKKISAYINQNTYEKLYGDVPIDSFAGKLFMKKLEELPTFKNDCIVECEYYEKYENDTHVYIPIKIRHDKIYPNSYTTVQKTILNVKENITIDELTKYLND